MKLSELRPKKRLGSFRYALRGVKILFEGTPNVWIHLSAAILVVVAGVVWNISAGEWTAVALACGVVFAAEAANSALEELADYACRFEQNAQIGRAKDLAAAGVLLAAGGAVVVGLVVFVPKILDLFS